MGIEPTFEAWEAPVLPLNYTRDLSECATVYRNRPTNVTTRTAAAGEKSVKIKPRE